MNVSSRDVDRFWAKVDKSGDCWLWTAHVMKNGYGQFRVGGRRENGGRLVLPHRFAYEVTVGPIPKGLELDHRHTCLKRCVRPDHLRPVTRKQNEENRPGARRDSTSGVRGVAWDHDRSKWRATVKHHGRSVHVGRFLTLEAAEAAVIAKRLELFTHNDLDRQPA